MIRTTLAVSTLALLAGCADSQRGSYARNDAGMYYGENRSVNNWGTATPRVEENEWNRSRTTVGPNGIERNDGTGRTWSNNDRYNNDRNYNDPSSGTYSNSNNYNNQNRSSNNWTPNEPNRNDSGMSRSDNQYDQNRQSNNYDQNRQGNNNYDQNRQSNNNYNSNNYDQNRANSPSQNYNNQNQNQGQNYSNDNTRRDTMRVTPSQGDNQFGQNTSGTMTVDAYFGKCATGLNRFEIEAGELAIQRTKNEQVKNFAQMMVNDHKKAQSELENVMRQGSWNSPSQLDSSHTELLNYLRQLDGQQFDTEYMSAMAAGHAMAVSMFKDKAKTLQNSELRSWTERQVPGLEKHLENARSINDRVRPR